MNKCQSVTCGLQVQFRPLPPSSTDLVSTDTSIRSTSLAAKWLHYVSQLGAGFICREPFSGFKCCFTYKQLPAANYVNESGKTVACFFLKSVNVNKMHSNHFVYLCHHLLKVYLVNM